MMALRPPNAVMGRIRMAEPIRPSALHQRRTVPPTLPANTAFDAGGAGALAESSPQNITDGGSRQWHRFEHVRVVGPSEAAAVSAAAIEELFVASAGEGVIVLEWFVEVLFERGSPDQHASRAVDHRDRPGRKLGRRIKAAFCQPMIRCIENRKHRTADDLHVVMQRHPDHLSKPIRIRVFVVIENGDEVGCRRRAAGAHESAVICIGVTAAGLDDAG